MLGELVHAEDSPLPSRLLLLVPLSNVRTLLNNTQKKDRTQCKSARSRSYKIYTSLRIAMMQQEDKRAKVKKGWLAVRVGLEEGGEGGGGGRFRRFVIPISYLHHPLFKRLLDSAYEVYGYHLAGPLRLPCSADDFLHLLWRIERESSRQTRSSRGHGPGHQHHYYYYFPLHSC